MKFFAAHSTQITILDLANSAESVISSLKSDFPSTSFHLKKCDISSWDEQKAAFHDVYKETGSIDFAFANAGVSEIGKFLEVQSGEPVKPNLRTIDINLVGTLYS